MPEKPSYGDIILQNRPEAFAAIGGTAALLAEVIRDVDEVVTTNFGPVQGLEDIVEGTLVVAALAAGGYFLGRWRDRVHGKPKSA